MISLSGRSVRRHHAPFDGNEEYGREHPAGSAAGVNDYAIAVAEYRKTFPSKSEVIAQTPDPAIREMLLHMQDTGCDTAFDRFDAQKPHCTFGLAGVCCRNCMMGPCRITAKSPRSVCGADADLIVARNLLLLTNGCASFPLMKLGFCRVEAAERAGAGLREFLRNELPPVWHMGEGKTI